MKIVILGAGKTGRGFLPRLVGDAEITFIDKNPALIENLKKAGSYEIAFFNDRTAIRISGYKAYTVDETGALAALKECDAVFVSVRGENTPLAAEWLQDKITDDTVLLACENATFPASLMGPLSGRSVSAAVFCTTVQNGTLDILSEDYPCLHADKNGLPSWLMLPGIAAEDNFPLLMLRKIYTYNAASAIISYIGAKKGISVFAEAATDPEVVSLLDKFYSEINRAICLEYSLPEEVQTAFAQASKDKFQSFLIADSVERNAANPERKLGPTERMIAPAKLILKHKGDPQPLVKAICAALDYMGANTPSSKADALAKLCKLTAGEELYRLIMENIA